MLSARCSAFLRRGCSVLALGMEWWKQNLKVAGQVYGARHVGVNNVRFRPCNGPAGAAFSHRRRGGRWATTVCVEHRHCILNDVTKSTLTIKLANIDMVLYMLLADTGQGAIWCCCWFAGHGGGGHMHIIVTKSGIFWLGPCSSIQTLRGLQGALRGVDRKSTRLNSSHVATSYAVFCL